MTRPFSSGPLPTLSCTPLAYDTRRYCKALAQRYGLCAGYGGGARLEASSPGLKPAMLAIASVQATLRPDVA